MICKKLKLIQFGLIWLELTTDGCWIYRYIFALALAFNSIDDVPTNLVLSIDYQCRLSVSDINIL